MLTRFKIDSLIRRPQFRHRPREIAVLQEASKKYVVELRNFYKDHAWFRNTLLYFSFLMYLFIGAAAFYAVEVLWTPPFSLDPRLRGNPQSCVGQYRFSGSIFYALSACSTIGFGQLHACTTLGRALTLVYCTFGIPFILYVLADVGSKICHLLVSVYGRTTKSISTAWKDYKWRRMLRRKAEEKRARRLARQKARAARQALQVTRRRHSPNNSNRIEPCGTELASLHYREIPKDRVFATSEGLSSDAAGAKRPRTKRKTNRRRKNAETNQYYYQSNNTNYDNANNVNDANKLNDSNNYHERSLHDRSEHYLERGEIPSPEPTPTTSTVVYIDDERTLLTSNDSLLKSTAITPPSDDDDELREVIIVPRLEPPEEVPLVHHSAELPMLTVASAFQVLNFFGKGIDVDETDDDDDDDDDDEDFEDMRRPSTHSSEDTSEERAPPDPGDPPDLPLWVCFVLIFGLVISIMVFMHEFDYVDYTFAWYYSALFFVMQEYEIRDFGNTLLTYAILLLGLGVISTTINVVIYNIQNLTARVSRKLPEAIRKRKQELADAGFPDAEVDPDEILRELLAKEGGFLTRAAMPDSVVSKLNSVCEEQVKVVEKEIEQEEFQNLKSETAETIAPDEDIDKVKGASQKTGKPELITRSTCMEDPVVLMMPAGIQVDGPKVNDAQMNTEMEVDLEEEQIQTASPPIEVECNTEPFTISISDILNNPDSPDIRWWLKLLKPTTSDSETQVSPEWDDISCQAVAETLESGVQNVQMGTDVGLETGDDFLPSTSSIECQTGSELLPRKSPTHKPVRISRKIGTDPILSPQLVLAKTQTEPQPKQISVEVEAAVEVCDSSSGPSVVVNPVRMSVEKFEQMSAEASTLTSPTISMSQLSLIPKHMATQTYYQSDEFIVSSEAQTDPIWPQTLDKFAQIQPSVTTSGTNSEDLVTYNERITNTDEVRFYPPDDELHSTLNSPMSPFLDRPPGVDEATECRPDCRTIKMQFPSAMGAAPSHGFIVGPNPPEPASIAGPEFVKGHLAAAPRKHGTTIVYQVPPNTSTGRDHLPGLSPSISRQSLASSETDENGPSADRNKQLKAGGPSLSSSSSGSRLAVGDRDEDDLYGFPKRRTISNAVDFINTSAAENAQKAGSSGMPGVPGSDSSTVRRSLTTKRGRGAGKRSTTTLPGKKGNR